MAGQELTKPRVYIFLMCYKKFWTQFLLQVISRSWCLTVHTKGQGNSGLENPDRTKTVPASKPGKQLVLNVRSYWEEHIGMLLWIISWKEKGKVKQAKDF